MPDSYTYTCADPQHEARTGSPAAPTAVPMHRGKHRRYCPTCAAIRETRRPTRKSRPTEITPAMVRALLAVPTVTNSLDEPATGEAGEPTTLGDTIADATNTEQEYSDTMLPTTITVPIPFDGLTVRIEGRKGRAVRHQPTGIAVLHDGLDYSIVRSDDGRPHSGEDVTAWVAYEAQAGNPLARQIISYVSSEEWADKLHAVLEQFRVHSAAGLLDGPAPVIPPASGPAGLN